MVRLTFNEGQRTARTGRCEECHEAEKEDLSRHVTMRGFYPTRKNLLASSASAHVVNPSGPSTHVKRPVTGSQSTMQGTHPRRVRSK